MSKRKYDGTPIDLTWNSGPWANDGETVDATDSETGEIQTTMQSEPPELGEDSYAKVADYIRKRLLDGAIMADLPYAAGTINRAAKGKSEFADVDTEVPVIEHTTGNATGEWVIANYKEAEKDAQDMTDTQEQATEDTTTTTDTEPPTYHPPERDSNRRLAYGVALVALVSYALGKLRGGDE